MLLLLMQLMLSYPSFVDMLAQNRNDPYLGNLEMIPSGYKAVY